MPGEPPVLTALGSGTLVPDARRHSAAYHLRAGRASVLLDCGAGTLHGFAAHGVAWRELTHIAVSHFHTDHVGELPPVMFAFEHAVGAQRTEPLRLVGPPGFRDLVERFRYAHGDSIVDPGFPVQVVEIDPGDPLDDPELGVTITAAPTPHTEESVCYRLSGRWGAVGYTGDTGPSREVADHLAGVDVLVAECGMTDPPSVDTHLSPARLAELAGHVRPRLLVVTHVYPPQQPDEALARVRARYEGPAVAAYDGLRVTLRPEGPVVDAPPGAG
ncbi:MAG TPA: ribonuclease Z [Longimicrobiales bacterium]|nr:ribonuclease Z [Longimicrobiales bacterium]